MLFFKYLVSLVLIVWKILLGLNDLGSGLVTVGMPIITPPLATTIFQLFECNLPSELARQAPAQPTIEE